MLSDDEIRILIKLADKARFIRDTKDSSQAVDDIGDKAERAGKRSSKAFGLMGRGLTGVARAAKYGAVVAIGGLVVEAKRSIEAFEESRKVGAQTNAVLRSTGGEANVSRKQIDRMTDALSRKTGMDDEAIQGAQNTLLTYRQIRNEMGAGEKVYNRATRVMLDLAAARELDASAAADQVGKAINDPIKGMTRLSRIGVDFNEQQRERIEDYVKLGDVQAAQGVILQELEKQFGGSAAAQATALDRLGVSAGNIEESFGATLSPAVDEAAEALDNFLVDAQPELDRISGRIEGVFAKDNLDLGEKFRRAARLLRDEAEPFGRDFEQLLRDADLDEKLQDAVEWAAPKIADGMAAAAPKAAEAFVGAFQNAGPWGKLLTAAFLASKMGAFRTVGRSAADTFVGRFGGQVGTTIGPELTKPGTTSRLDKIGAGWGKLMGVAMVASLGLALRDWLKDMPALEQYSGSEGWGELKRDVLDWLPGEDSEERRARIREQQRRSASAAAGREQNRRLAPVDLLNPGSGGLGSLPLPPSRLPNTRRPRRGGQPRAKTSSVEVPVTMTVDGDVLGEAFARRDLRQRDLDGDD